MSKETDRQTLQLLDPVIFAGECAACLLPEPGDHTQAAGHLGSRGILQSHRLGGELLQSEEGRHAGGG